jgi:D-threo-aldose 1-dehydrogenase
VTGLALGTAALGDSPDPDEAVATMLAAAAAGVRHFDTSPWYGRGEAEQRLGKALTQLPAGSVSVSTKVGYVIPAQGRVQDFSADAVLRSLDASLHRLGISTVDTVLVHDPDDHERQALDETLPTLHRLKSEGVIRAIGVGMNQTPMLTRFVRDTDIDAVLVAGRYTLLDHKAADELLPLCARRGVLVWVGGVFNSGLLADPHVGASYDYQPVDDETLARALALERIWAERGVPLAAAALRFPARHPAVTEVLIGPRDRAELATGLRHWAMDIPEGTP